MKSLTLAACLVAAAIFAPVCKAAVTVSASGTQLLLNGNPWEPHGVVSIALVQTSLVRASTGTYADAYNAFSETELDDMKTYGVDTIRFQISQPGLDPDDTSGNYDPTFLPDVESKVNMALNDGFIVILCLQNENQGGTYVEPTMPNDETKSVWRNVLALDSNFENVPNVIFEVFNEPQGSANTADWTTWENTHNNSIRGIRAAGADNVIIADGLEFAETLSGAPDLTDPIASETQPAQIAYATHPFFHTADEQKMATWETNFGDFAATHAVVNTAWGAEYNCGTGSGYLNTADQSLALLQYMHSINVGMMAYAMDNQNNAVDMVPNDGKMFATINPWSLSTLVGVDCGAPDTDLIWGPGKIINTWYTTGTPPTSLE